MKKNTLCIRIMLSSIIIAACILCCTVRSASAASDAKSMVTDNWRAYKKYFILTDGRVLRPTDNTTVSEGQAYAMLRAVIMKDKETFDLCYTWTETHLSRFATHGDHLLSWLWENDAIADPMPASDADIDYALALILAHIQWGSMSAPLETEEYEDTARAVLRDILDDETYRMHDMLVLTPWILSETDKISPAITLNPSYFSPAHFRIFDAFMPDSRWQELIDSSYAVLTSLGQFFDGTQGKGLIPDWCMINTTDLTCAPVPHKSQDYGWDAVRIPIRIGLDALIFQSPEASTFLMQTFIPFFTDTFATSNSFMAGYTYAGDPISPDEHPLFCASAAIALIATQTSGINAVMQKLHASYTPQGLYIDKTEYFVNSLAWLADSIICGHLDDSIKEIENAFKN